MKKNSLDLFNDQDYKPYKNSAKLKQKKKKIKNINLFETNSNKWTVLQNQRFLEFIKNNKDLLLSPSRRKEEKVFLQLSNSVKTRSADQCRSHHQKLIKHHTDLEGVIRNLEQRLQNQIEEQEKMAITEKIQNQKKEQDAKLADCCLSKIMQFESESIKQEEKFQQDLWGMLHRQAWLDQSIFCPYNLLEQQI